MDGFHEAVSATVKSIAEGGRKGSHINLFPDLFRPKICGN
jgi:hypothetical protein